MRRSWPQTWQRPPRSATGCALIWWGRRWLSLTQDSRRRMRAFTGGRHELLWAPHGAHAVQNRLLLRTRGLPSMSMRDGSAVPQAAQPSPTTDRHVLACRSVLPEEDSNLRPSDYPFPEVSLGRGLSHHHDRSRSVGAGRLVSEPSRGVPRAWLRIALAFSRFRFPAIHPVFTPKFP